MARELESVVGQAKALIQLLALEVASELELHYDPDEFYALGATIESLVKARTFMEEHNVKVPQVVTNVISRFYSQQN